MEKSLQQCLDLLKENEETVRNDAENALLTICQNMLSHPNDRQYRKILLNDPIVIQKLLPAIGAMECLFEIGFVEGTDCLDLPQETPLTKIQTLESLLAKNSVKVNSAKVKTVDSIAVYDLLPPTSSKREKRFLTEIIRCFQGVLQYEDPSLQEKARKVIPIVELEISTVTRVRELQKHVKLADTEAKKKYVEDLEDTKDLFLMELLHWFKYEFFTWIDTLKCSACSSDCRYEEVVKSEDPKCSRVEIHRCTNCQQVNKFLRYSNPEPLLTLRRGRCGEWANVFTLFCRTLGYDARLVHDQTDHVWTEVWSIREKRWIHVDPCEDTIDRPLMYEKGWKKKLTYIIAFSKDEVQDVTWRYTRDLLGVLKRRNLCSETKLLQFIESLNKLHQTSANYSATRRKYVTKRRLLELVELLHMPQDQGSTNDDDNYQERSTGSYEWKLARGEISESSSRTSYTWDLSKHDNTFHLHYSIVQDAYKVTNNEGEVLEHIQGWQNGINEVHGGVFRKVENDWKMVYLARAPETTCGKVKWNFIISNSDLCINTISLRAATTVFHDAKVTWEIEGFLDETNLKKLTVLPINDSTNYCTDELKGCVRLILTATITGGKRDTAWQHAQLFRQSLENKEDRSLMIDIELQHR